MGWSLRVRLRRFDLVNLVFLKLILLFQEDSDSSGDGVRPPRRLRPLAVQTGPVEAEPVAAGDLEPEPAEIDLAGAVVKVLWASMGVLYLLLFQEEVEDPGAVVDFPEVGSKV